MTSRTRFTLAAVPLLIAAPLLSACGGSANAAHDACMGEAAVQAAAIDGVDSSTYEGDYDLMALCDSLVEAYPDDSGRVVHAVGCVADYVEDNITDGVFSEAYRSGSTAADLMDDPMSVGVCL